VVRKKPFERRYCRIQAVCVDLSIKKTTLHSIEAVVRSTGDAHVSRLEKRIARWSRTHRAEPSAKLRENIAR